jgi:hypothetical protein
MNKNLDIPKYDVQYANPKRVFTTGIVLAVEVIIESIVIYTLWNKFLALGFQELPQLDFTVIASLIALQMGWSYIMILLQDVALLAKLNLEQKRNQDNG